MATCMPRVLVEILRGWSHSSLPNPAPSQPSHPSNTIMVIPDAFLYLGFIPLAENMVQVEVAKKTTSDGKLLCRVLTFWYPQDTFTAL